MNDRDDELRQTTALFRYGLIADLVHLPLGAPGTAAKLSDKAGQTYAIPGTTRTRVAANTMRDWIRLYRDGGFEALYPKPRADRGQPRRMPPEVAHRLVGLKADNPHLVGAQRHPGGHRGRHRPPARRLDRAPAVQPRGPVRQKAPGRRRPPPLRLQGRRRAVDERRHARAKGPARQKPPQDLPHRLHRRRHPRRPLRRLRHRREHSGIPAGVQERHHPARHPPAPLRR